MQIDWFPLWLSLRVAIVSTAIAVAAGLWIAYILANRDFRGKEALDAAVTLPLARRSIFAAAALAFARSLGDFGVTLMVAGNIPGRTQTVAVAIYDAVEAGNGTLARTLVLVVSAAALLILGLANRLGPR